MNERESGECEIEKRVAGLQRAVEEMSGRTDRDRIANLIATAKRPPERQRVPSTGRAVTRNVDSMAGFEKSR
jgi:hypothetical protein